MGHPPVHVQRNETPIRCEYAESAKQFVGALIFTQYKILACLVFRVCGLALPHRVIGAPMKPDCFFWNVGKRDLKHRASNSKGTCFRHVQRPYFGCGWPSAQINHSIRWHPPHSPSSACAKLEANLDRSGAAQLTRSCTVCNQQCACFSGPRPWHNGHTPSGRRSTADLFTQAVQDAFPGATAPRGLSWRAGAGGWLRRMAGGERPREGHNSCADGCRAWRPWQHVRTGC